MEDLRLDSLAGVGPVTTKKLSDAGIHNIMDLIVRGPVELAEITGMDKEAAGNIVEKARQALVEGGMISKDFVTASEIYKRRQEMAIAKSLQERNVSTCCLMAALKHKH